MKITEKMIRNVSKIIVEQTFDLGFKLVNEYIINKECVCSSFNEENGEWVLNYTNLSKNFTLNSIATHIENVIKMGTTYKISIVGK